MSTPTWPVASIALALFFLIGGCHKVALTKRPEAEANTALGVLHASGIEGEKVAVSGGFDIQVPAHALLAAVEALGRAGLPRRTPQGWSEALGEPGLLPSRLEEKMRLLQASTGEITRTLLSLPGVVDARVHLAPESQDPTSGGSNVRRSRGGNLRVSKASILLRVLGRSAPAPSDSEAVRALVAGALPGLNAAAVEVVVVSAVAPSLNSVHTATAARSNSNDADVR